jgi:hypothetical protein
VGKEDNLHPKSRPKSQISKIELLTPAEFDESQLPSHLQANLFGIAAMRHRADLM